MSDQDRLLATGLLTPETLHASAIVAKSYKARSAVSDRIGGVPHIGVVDAGRVEVFCIASDGTEIHLSSIEPGGLFGVSNLFETGSLRTLLTTSQDSRLIFYPKAYVEEALAQDPSLSLAYARLCTTKIQFLLEKIECLLVQSGRVKLVEYLLRNRDENDLVSLDCSKEALGKKLGISRACVYRELKFLKSEGLVEVHKSCIQLNNSKALYKLLS